MSVPKTKSECNERPKDQKATAKIEYRMMTSRMTNDEVATAVTKATAEIELRVKSLELSR